MGRNGSGKSTLANVVVGRPEYTITSGEILYDGRDITGWFPRRERGKAYPGDAVSRRASGRQDMAVPQGRG